ncbi:response regulator transcription factor [Ramlibacter humi]|uniref:helix-turn-helix transcriptional regulator n=1 Tax=Ramlibacter humi TaxID=2530451 RepID=UPI003F6CA96F
MEHLTCGDYLAMLGLLERLERMEEGQCTAAAFARAVRWSLRESLPCDDAGLLACEAGQEGLMRAQGAKGVLLAALANGSSTQVMLRLRRAQPFSAREREQLALLQPHLAYVYRHTFARGGPPVVALPPAGPLTPREGDVMRWLSCGKTDADIAALLAISPRTVHKHLEHIYEKLGVETRTAAVMALQRSQRPATAGRTTRSRWPAQPMPANWRSGNP